MGREPKMQIHMAPWEASGQAGIPEIIFPNPLGNLGCVFFLQASVFYSIKWVNPILTGTLLRSNMMEFIVEKYKKPWDK